LQAKIVAIMKTKMQLLLGKKHLGNKQIHSSGSEFFYRIKRENVFYYAVEN